MSYIAQQDTNHSWENINFEQYKEAVMQVCEICKAVVYHVIFNKTLFGHLSNLGCFLYF